jgi:thiamine kinase-like enzyme
MHRILKYNNITGASALGLHSRALTAGPTQTFALCTCILVFFINFSHFFPGNVMFLDFENIGFNYPAFDIINHIVQSHVGE